METVTLKQARDNGLPRYFTGVPCKHGHVAERLVVNRTCERCLDITSKVWKKENKEQVAATSRAWQKANPEKMKASKKRNHEKDKSKQAARSRKHYDANPHKALERHYAWAKRNPGMVTAAAGRRRANKRQRVAPWADHRAIAEIYKQCQELSRFSGVLYHVDHIVPLQGRDVSGLHVESNLQIILAKDNQSKSNKLL